MRTEAHRNSCGWHSETSLCDIFIYTLFTSTSKYAGASLSSSLAHFLQASVSR